ncbi:uncharacterized protein CTRU02_202555 [Colletotrichum truncatum]|uniref:Uncharacterized protein n=1 Tax=Colletotrichum truncatum TaxID=5467 RepID=A0ACC3ZL77_COLTU|nr:uncharacterized protein CTRU02_01723 [Colletotrichum truncatum]KAF6800044.1 hypothetical protein CTRU02_01723 [Colletotrichum truncatum]
MRQVFSLSCISREEHEDGGSKPLLGNMWRQHHLHTPKNTMSSADRSCLERKRSWFILTWGLGAVLSFVLLAISIASLFQISNHHTQYDVLPGRQSLYTCGPTAATAREQGCHFDLMSASWVQTDCFDKELMHEYVHAGFHERNWTFWRDNEGEVGAQMPKDEVLLGEWEVIWASGDFHYAHCAYFWEKQWTQFRAGGSVVTLDSRIRFAHHTKHCIDFVRAPNITYIQGKASSKIHQRFGLLECVIGPM